MSQAHNEGGGAKVLHDFEVDSASGNTYEDADVGLGLVALLVFYRETPHMVHTHIVKRRYPFESFSW